MAYIKDINKFSQDAINMAMETLTNDEKHALNNSLKKVYKKLASASNVEGSQKPITKRGASDERLFREEILLKIERKLKEIENAEYRGEMRRVVLDFNFNVQFEKMNFQQLIEEHGRLVKLDGELAQAALVVKFLRGKLYIYLQHVAQKNGMGFRDLIEKQIGLVYQTVLRYILIAQMIIKYPRLILCDLNFTQLLVYKSKLLKFFAKEGKELADRLAGPVYMEVQGKSISIQHCDINPANIRMKTPADWEIRDAYEQETPSEQAVAAIASETIKSISECPDEVEELERMITQM